MLLWLYESPVVLRSLLIRFIVECVCGSMLNLNWTLTIISDNLPIARSWCLFVLSILYHVSRNWLFFDFRIRIGFPTLPQQSLSFKLDLITCHCACEVMRWLHKQLVSGQGQLLRALQRCRNVLIDALFLRSSVSVSVPAFLAVAQNDFLSLTTLHPLSLRET